ncbi:MAG: OmpA family protein [Flavobacteriales bacterium]|nr:OmpA family protein [Flavobacteriales bacterium]
MKISKVVGLGFLFCLFSLQMAAQKSYLEDADKALMKEEKYFEAIELYKKAYVKEPGRDVKAEIIFKIAEAYRLSDQPQQAEVWYDKSVIAQYTDPVAKLRLGDMKMMNGKYDEALVAFQKYVADDPTDPRGKRGIAAAEKAQAWADNPKNYTVEPAVLINSEFYDYNPTFSNRKNSELIFTSSREGSIGSDVSDVTGGNFSDLYITKRDKKGKWSEPVLVEGEGVNTEDSEGGAVMNSRRNTMYYTRCRVEKDGYMGCQILSAKGQGVKFSTPVPIDISSDSAVIGHPALTGDDKILIFASDMSGGQGGKDLWYIREESRGKWSDPINLGPEINTDGNEMFPYIRENGNLYFASDGHLGMGGLDIFSAENVGDGQWNNVQNLKAPINSSANDFAITFDGKKNKGFFSSSREGGRGKDDIWQFNEPPILFVLKGIVKDIESGQPLVAANVKLIGTDGSSSEQQTGADGTFEFAQNGDASYINENTSYSITVSKPQYLNARGKETTVGITESKIFAHLYELQPITEKAIKLPEIVYPFNKANITAEAGDSLEFLRDILVDNPTLVIELRANTDSRGGDDYNLELSQRRADSAVGYLIRRGIDAERMVPKGYGENALLISDDEIAKLASEEEREAAHQVNRRTEFSILRDDFVPKNQGEEVPVEEGNDGEEIDDEKTEEATPPAGDGSEPVDEGEEELTPPEQDGDQ